MSSLTGAAQDAEGGIEVSAAGQAAIRRAIDVLTPYRSEPRLAALVSKLASIADPDGSSISSHTNKLAKSLVEVQKAVAEDGPQPLLARTALSKAAAPAQLAYLRQMSPAAAEAYEASRPAA